MVGKRVKARRKAKLFDAGFRKPSGSFTHHKYWALRFLQERGFDFSRAISGLQERIEIYRGQLQRSLKEKSSKKLVAGLRQQIANDTNAINELMRLRRAGPDAWLSKARAVYERDTIAGVSGIPFVELPAEERARILLSLSGAAEKGDAEGTTKQAGRLLSKPAAPGANRRELEASLKTAIAVAMSQSAVTEAKIEEARGHKASQKVIEALQRYNRIEAETIAFLEAIDALPTEEKIRKLIELRY